MSYTHFTVRFINDAVFTFKIGDPFHTIKLELAIVKSLRFFTEEDPEVASLTELGDALVSCEARDVLEVAAAEVAEVADVADVTEKPTVDACEIVEEAEEDITIVAVEEAEAEEAEAEEAYTEDEENEEANTEDEDAAEDILEEKEDYMRALLSQLPFRITHHRRS